MANPFHRETPTSVQLFLPMLPDVRPVDAEWKCQQSGDCCTKPAEVLMTKEEAAVLVHAAPSEITMRFRPADDTRFVLMEAGPCPLFQFNGCVVYAVRPYNCRRFACMRPDPTTEPWEFTKDGDCANLQARLKTSRVVRRLMATIQRRAQRWAFRHGWSPDG